MPKIVRTYKIQEKMTFIERIKQLREQHQLPQRKIAEALDIDGATYCKIERGDLLGLFPVFQNAIRK